jgi:hypothetical protein
MCWSSVLEKPFLDLYRNLLQPSLGAFGPFLRVQRSRLKIPDPVLGGTKLQRKLVCDA